MSSPLRHPAPSAQATTSFARAVVIANPIAGRGRSMPAARELAAGLGRLGIENALHFTEARGDARLFLRGCEPGYDLVVAVGGDGTVSEVLDGLVDRSIPVAILPMGTANVMSLDFGIPRDVDRALEMIAHGRSTALDVARINQRHLSFLVTGVGFDAMVVRELERRRKGPITKATWTRAGIDAWWTYPETRLEVEVDGARLPGTYGVVLVSNIIHYGGFKCLATDRRIDDGLFEVYLFEKGSRFALMKYAMRGFLRGFPGGSCTRRLARRVRVTSEVAVPYQVDGDLKGETPVEIEVSEHQFRLMIP